MTLISLHIIYRESMYTADYHIIFFCLRKVWWYTSRAKQSGGLSNCWFVHNEQGIHNDARCWSNDGLFAFLCLVFAIGEDCFIKCMGIVRLWRNTDEDIRPGGRIYGFINGTVKTFNNILNFDNNKHYSIDQSDYTE